MAITKEDVHNIVVQTLQEMIGDKTIKIAADAMPIGAYGLDSQDGIEFAIYVSERLNCDVPVELNPFVDDNGETVKQRTVGEIVDLLVSLALEAKG